MHDGAPSLALRKHWFHFKPNKIFPESGEEHRRSLAHAPGGVTVGTGCPARHHQCPILFVAGQSIESQDGDVSFGFKCETKGMKASYDKCFRHCHDSLGKSA